jgi:2-oxoglutarate dehydrogenase E1 component
MATPKSLLRHPSARSHLADVAPGSRFQRMIPESSRKIWSSVGVPNPAVTRLVLCSGKVYYDLVDARDKLGEHNVAIARVEQLAPFPFDLVKQHADVCCQKPPSLLHPSSSPPSPPSPPSPWHQHDPC